MLDIKHSWYQFSSVLLLRSNHFSQSFSNIIKMVLSSDSIIVRPISPCFTLYLFSCTSLPSKSPGSAVRGESWRIRRRNNNYYNFDVLFSCTIMIILYYCYERHSREARNNDNQKRVFTDVTRFYCPLRTACALAPPHTHAYT